LESNVSQVLNAAWDAGIQVASENALPCYDRDGFNKILENAKPLNDPDGRHLFGFTEFERFVKRMHGKMEWSDGNPILAPVNPMLTSCDVFFAGEAVLDLQV
jgi:hypothetical protein